MRQTSYLCDKPYKVTNVIRDKTNNARNVINDKRNNLTKATNVISFNVAYDICCSANGTKTNDVKIK